MEIFFTGLLLILLLALLLSPLESLAWFAGWFNESPVELGSTQPVEPPDAATDRPYLVFLTGIGGFARDRLLPEERRLLDRLTAKLPDIRIVDDIYPYASTDRALEDGRFFSWLWRFAIFQKEKRRILGFLINIRNLLQVFVAADPRYSPIYSEGLGQVILRGLKRHGYPFGSGAPVILLGYSGGGEMAISAVTPLKEALGAPIYVISLAGVMSNDPYVADVTHLYHIYGQHDPVQRSGALLFPGRWRVAWRSVWNRARRDGRITLVPMGAMKHNGRGGYLDETTTLPDGRTYFDKTIQTIAGLVRQIG